MKDMTISQHKTSVDDSAYVLSAALLFYINGFYCSIFYHITFIFYTLHVYYILFNIKCDLTYLFYSEKVIDSKADMNVKDFKLKIVLLLNMH